MFSVSSGALPTGLILNSATGAITGTPTTAGTFTLHDHGDGHKRLLRKPAVRNHHRQYGLPGHHIESDDAAAGDGLVPVLQQITASGGTPPYTFVIAAGALPPGLFLSTTGLISGAPQQTGLFNVTIRATDLNGCQGSRSYSLVILPALPPAGGPTLNFAGLMILTVLLAAAGLFVMNKFSI